MPPNLVKHRSCCWNHHQKRHKIQWLTNFGDIFVTKDPKLPLWVWGILPVVEDRLFVEGRRNQSPDHHPIFTALHLTSDIVYPCLVEGASEDGLITNSCCNVKPSRWRPNPLPAPSTIILHRLRLKIISHQSFRINFQQCRFFSTGVT